ncbi:hypothetical protein BDW74DRAFT_184067 [Aspergillus multicolor]|uniref:uncharacterized protein n=1 Tax=Aspergillus multicolor TaxID=41759 RepID=UPI003CCE0BB4
MPNQDPIGVHLVGSIPLPTAETVFRTLPQALPSRLHTLPDGETSTRYNWIEWQTPCFPRETLRPVHGGIALPPNHPGPDVFTADSIGPTNYDTAALSAYAHFVSLREDGTIPADIRFQWDVAVEVLALEYESGRLENEFFRPHFINEDGGVRAGVLARLQRICAGIPGDVELGFHFCYGDAGHRHFVEPVDLGVVVGLVNGVVDVVGSIRDIGWVHMPVPKGRDDEAYFEPLRELRIAQETRLYLGLVHTFDLEGTRRRIRAAQGVVKRGFGVATECGIGRTPKEVLKSILEISREVAATIERR